MLYGRGTTRRCTHVAVVQHNVESTCIYTSVQSHNKVTIQYLMLETGVWRDGVGGMVCEGMVSVEG